MPDGLEEVLPQVRNVAGALLFLQGGTYALDAIGGLNSSPWTAETFGGDPEKLATSRNYVVHAVVMSSLFGGIAATVAHSWWPIIGVALSDAYLWWIYSRAWQRALEASAQAPAPVWNVGGVSPQAA